MPPSTPARNAMPLDALGEQIGKVEDVLKGLYEPEASPDMQAALEEQKRVAACFARMAATPDGQEVLEHLCDVTLRRPTFIAHLSLDPMRAYGLGCQREGANSLTYYILKLIALGREEPAPQREGSEL